MFRLKFAYLTQLIRLEFWFGILFESGFLFICPIFQWRLGIQVSLVALGNRQEYGVDYEETFALVTKMTTICTVISITASQGWPLLQMDVKNAFLYCDLKEQIYMTQPLLLQMFVS